MKKFFVLLVFLFMTINLISALDCQYTQNEDYSVIEPKLVYVGTETIFSDPLIIEQAGQNEYKKPTIKLTNTINQDILINIQYTQITSSSLTGASSYTSQISNLSVSQNDVVTLEGMYGFDSSYSTYIDLNSVQYSFIQPELELKTLQITKTRLVCSLCLGKDCLNDGAPCSRSEECGGDFCVEGYCSNSVYCDNLDCKCTSDEIQCDNNRQCVKQSIVPIDVKPECNKPQECVTGYIDSKSGLCAKSPAQILEEEEQKLKEEQDRKEKERVFLICAVLGIAFVIALFCYYEKEKQKTIETETKGDIKILHKEIELEGIKMQRKEYELNEFRQQIKEIERQKHKTQQEIESLRHLKSQRDDLISDIESQYEKVTQPFPDPQASNMLVVINPYLSGYKCFYKKGLPLEDYPVSKLVHRWVWKKHNGRDPRYGYHIHHIDKNKYNNDPNNLEEVEGNEHFAIHRY